METKIENLTGLVVKDLGATDLPAVSVELPWLILGQIQARADGWDGNAWNRWSALRPVQWSEQGFWQIDRQRSLPGAEGLSLRGPVGLQAWLRRVDPGTELGLAWSGEAPGRSFWAGRLTSPLVGPPVWQTEAAWSAGQEQGPVVRLWGQLQGVDRQWHGRVASWVGWQGEAALGQVAAGWTGADEVTSGQTRPAWLSLGAAWGQASLRSELETGLEEPTAAAAWDWTNRWRLKAQGDWGRLRTQLNLRHRLDPLALTEWQAQARLRGFLAPEGRLFGELEGTGGWSTELGPTVAAREGAGLVWAPVEAGLWWLQDNQARGRLGAEASLKVTTAQHFELTVNWQRHLAPWQRPWRAELFGEESQLTLTVSYSW